jgi:hypothetical protein
LTAYEAHVPTCEVILALDAGDVNWTGHRATATAPRAPNEKVWQYIHRKYRDAFRDAHGEWIVCVDDDDWFEPERLRALASAEADIVCASHVHVHELRSSARRTYRRVMHPPGLLESTVAFRRELLRRLPLDDPELGLWVQALRHAGARVEERTWAHVMFLHGANADLAAGRTALRVDAVTGAVHDGPNEYTLLGGRATAAEIVGEGELHAWELLT